MKPPDDAPLPWRTDDSEPNKVLDADGYGLGWTVEPRHADYVVAAANALPGLVEAIREAVRMQWREHPDFILAGLKDALAALPKEAGDP
jgi:hypothetical protein